MSLLSKRRLPTWMCIKSLPDEVLTIILSYTVTDINSYSRCSRVCISWNNIVSEFYSSLLLKVKWTILVVNKVYAVIGEHYYPPFVDYDLLLLGNGGEILDKLILCNQGISYYMSGSMMVEGESSSTERVIICKPSHIDDDLSKSKPVEDVDYSSPFFNFLDCSKCTRRAILGDYDYSIYEEGSSDTESSSDEYDI